MATVQAPEFTQTATDAGHSCFELLLARLGAAAARKPGQTLSLGITSCTPGEGVTTVAKGLAATAASGDEFKPILLIETCPSRSSTRSDATAGLADVLAGRTWLDSAIADSEIPGLQKLGPGNQADVSVGAAAESLAAIWSKVCEKYNLIVVDL